MAHLSSHQSSIFGSYCSSNLIEMGVFAAIKLKNAAQAFYERMKLHDVTCFLCSYLERRCLPLRARLNSRPGSWPKHLFLLFVLGAWCSRTGPERTGYGLMPQVPARCLVAQTISQAKPFLVRKKARQLPHIFCKWFRRRKRPVYYTYMSIMY